MKVKNSLTTKFMLGMALVITAMMTVNLVWSLRQYRSQAEGEMKEKATVIAQQLIATRAFIAAKQDVINADSSGCYQFKHLNPAAVGKGVGDIFNSYSGYKFKQTRLKVREPDNAPDNFEVEALQQFAGNQGQLAELWGYDTVDGVRVFRYMVPLYFDQSCMACHGGPVGETDISGYPKEGYGPGDFAGAISVVFPLTAFEANLRENIFTQITFILFIVLVSMGLVYLVMEHIVVMPIQELTSKVVKMGRGDLSVKLTDINAYDEIAQLAREFNGMAEQLQQMYTGLEEKVGERPALLRQANARLLLQGRELKDMNERLKENDRLKSEFLAVMSHELRTPLTAIIAFAEILLAEGETLSSQQREYLEDIFESGHELLNQINDILDMSKIEAGLLLLNCREFDIKTILDELAVTFYPLLVKRKLAFTIAVAPATPLMNGDCDKIRHIIRNLISNAIKFTPAGGTIEIRVMPAGKAAPVAGVQIDVQDDGIGISRDMQAAIFERFVQVDTTDRREYSGSGLGLALAKRLVEMHGGTISVQSAVGQGSTFTVMLPQ